MEHSQAKHAGGWISMLPAQITRPYVPEGLNLSSQIRVKPLYSFIRDASKHCTPCWPINVVSCSPKWNNVIVDLFIINNGSCVLLAGSERDKDNCISPLLCKIIEPESWAFTSQWQKKKASFLWSRLMSKNEVHSFKYSRISQWCLSCALFSHPILFAVAINYIPPECT
jgi:hypothetical protein